MDQPRPEYTAVSPAMALRVELARVADDLMGMALRVSGIRQSRQSLRDMLADMPESEQAYFPLLHEDGSVGACLVSQNAVLAFVEQQTLGHLLREPMEEREMTQTDQSLTQPLVAGFLQHFNKAMIGAPTAFWTCGYRCEDLVGNKHLLSLKMDAAEFRLFQVSLDFLGTERGGEMQLILPIKQRPEAETTLQAQKHLPLRGEQPLRNFRKAALPARVVLQAKMCSFHLPIAKLKALSVGDIVALPPDAMQSACLHDERGKVAVPITLGQLNGFRAARVCRDRLTDPNALPAEPPQEMPETSDFGLSQAMLSMSDENSRGEEGGESFSDGLGDLGELGDVSIDPAPMMDDIDLGALGSDAEPSEADILEDPSSVMLAPDMESDEPISASDILGDDELDALLSNL